MPTLLVRRGAALFKIESVEAVDAVPDPSLDGVLVENIRITFNPNITETNEVTPSLDPWDPIVGGMSAQIEVDTYLRGSGTVITPPEWSKMLKVCGYSEQITAAAFPVTPEAFLGGAPTGTDTGGRLGTGPTTAQAYAGMPIRVVQGGAGTTDTYVANYSGGSGKSAIFSDTLPVTTTSGHTWQIQPHIRYQPASASISSGTIWIYNDGVLYKFVGCRGNVSFTLTSGGPARAAWRFMGMFMSKTDAALPTVVYDSARPPVWKDGRLTINSVQASGQTLTMDTGSNLVMPDNPNALEGFDPAIITARQPRGNINPKETLVATRDIMSSFRGQIKRPIHARFGQVAGNRVSFTVPSALYLNQTPGDQNGYRIVDVPFHMTGQDSGLQITLW